MKIPTLKLCRICDYVQFFDRDNKDGVCKGCKAANKPSKAPSKPPKGAK